MYYLRVRICVVWRVSVCMALYEAFTLLAVFLYYCGHKMALKRAERAHKADTIYSGSILSKPQHIVSTIYSGTQRNSPQHIVLCIMYKQQKGNKTTIYCV